jgi:hypothetical protein
MFPVMSYGVGDGQRHRVVLVDHEDGYKCVDANFSQQLYTDACFLTNKDQFIFQRVVYLKKKGINNP